MPEIAKMLTLSTGHVTEETCNCWIPEQNFDPPRVVAFQKGEYGWFIYVGGKERDEEDRQDEEIPDDLKTVMSFARKHRCTWLCLDRDGGDEVDLPTYEW